MKCTKLIEKINAFINSMLCFVVKSIMYHVNGGTVLEAP